MEGTARFRLLHELACAFASQMELDELVPMVVDRCRAVVSADAVALLLLDASRHELYFHTARTDAGAESELRGVRFPADRGIAGAVVGSGVALRVDDPAHDPRFYGAVDTQTGYTTRNLLCAPLRTTRGIIGVIQAVNHKGDGPFTDEQLGLFEALAGSIAVALENARAFDAVKAEGERLRVEVNALRRELPLHGRFPEIVGRSPVMRDLMRLMESAAGTTISVLVEGETGTGKELVARGIHRTSPRRDAPFVAVNCAAIPDTLLESQLFGHRRGAFTGADRDERGVFEAAHGGTLLLDEIGEMPVAMQAKLLRVLQEGEVVPLGETRPRHVDVRVLSSTNRDLASDITRNVFRRDLYYRLAAFPIHVPPLRARRDDIAPLAQHFAGATVRFAPDAMAALEQHDWPGNVRELENEIGRALALAAGDDPIRRDHLSPRVAGQEAGPTDATGPRTLPLREARAAFERRYLSRVLTEHGGNVSRAARALGITRAMLQRKMRTFDLR